MNEDEMLQEFVLDAHHVVMKTLQRLKEEYDHERHKRKISKTNPYVRDYCIRTGRKNHWIIILSKSAAAEKYSGIKDCTGSLITYYNSEKGLRVLKFMLQGTLAVFNGHFFTRYNQRMQLGLSNTIDIIKAYFKANMHADYMLIKKGKKYYAVGITQDGFLLGDYNDHILTNRTFISRDLLRTDQEVFEKKFIGHLQIEFMKKVRRRQQHGYGHYLGTDTVYLDEMKLAS